MKHGLVQGESFAGYSLMTPPSILLHNKIGLSLTGGAYRFVGYKSSILRYLIDNKDCVVNGANDAGFTIQMAVGEVGKTAAEQYSELFAGAALSVAGGLVSAVDMMNTVLDGVSVAGIVGDALPGGPNRSNAPVRPDKKAYAWDHAMNAKIIVDLSLYSGARNRWYDLKATRCTLHTIAFLVYNT